MTTIKLRRGTASEWTTSNPVLNDGEVGFERDTNKHKIGDGVTAWNSLKYFINETVISSVIAAQVAAIGLSSVIDTYTLVLTDAGKFIKASKATAFTITVPPVSSVAFPVGTVIGGIQFGAGQVTVYSEDCIDHHNYDEGESAHDSVIHVVRGGRKHHNVGGGGITNVGTSTLDADRSAAGVLEIDHNHTGSLNTKEGGISIYETTTVGVIGAGVVCHDNNGPGIYVEPGSTSTVNPVAVAAATGNANPNVVP